jgi:hypothetical protein
METLEDIKTYIANMETYCEVIESDATTKCKIDFTRLVGKVAKRIATKCDKLEKELANAEQDKYQG